MKRRVVVTGFDLICALGNNKETVEEALIKGDINMQALGEGKKQGMENIKIAKVMGIESNIIDNTSLDKSEIMARMVLNQALRDSGLNVNDIEELGNRASVSLATSVMGTDYIVNFKEKMSNISWVAKSKSFITRLAKEFRVGGGVYTTSSACASGTAAFGVGYDLIKNNRADIVLCGGTDHIIDISLFGFYTLETLSSDVCKPFDKARDGINLGEGSAFFILEDYEHAKMRSAKIYGEILGYGLANDAYHITSPDPNGKGALFAINTALEEAGISNEEKIYINAHGTGTSANDSMEYKAIQEVFADRKNIIQISSTKSLTGHCLGAAGSIEFALSMIMLQIGYVLPTRNSETDIDEHNILNQKLDGFSEFNCILSNSFAFGGNDASIVYGKIH